MSKYNADRVYRIIKKQKIPYNSLTKELIVDLIVKHNKKFSNSVPCIDSNQKGNSMSMTFESTQTRIETPQELPNFIPQSIHMQNINPAQITSNYSYQNNNNSDEYSLKSLIDSITTLKNQVLINQYNFNNFNTMLNNMPLTDNMRMGLLQLCNMNLVPAPNNSVFNTTPQNNAFNGLNLFTNEQSAVNASANLYSKELIDQHYQIETTNINNTLLTPTFKIEGNLKINSMMSDDSTKSTMYTKRNSINIEEFNCDLNDKTKPEECWHLNLEKLNGFCFPNSQNKDNNIPRSCQ